MNVIQNAEVKTPRLMDQVRGKMRLLHLAKRTEEAYAGWISGVRKYAKN
ncbi:MAG: hypothetical protein KatS3mg111_4370 [Pirellulaceae bacterium]|nr:MAG: hypothetical protein KatS3mg111_4370 [Pirellulaceae bacterium]